MPESPFMPCIRLYSRKLRGWRMEGKKGGEKGEGHLLPSTILPPKSPTSFSQFSISFVHTQNYILHGISKAVHISTKISHPIWIRFFPYALHSYTFLAFSAPLLLSVSLHVNFAYPISIIRPSLLTETNAIQKNNC